MNKLTLENVKDLLIIDKTNLDKIVENQAALYDDIADKATEIKSLRDDLKGKVDETFAKLSLNYRKEAEEKGEKMTEAKLQQLVQTDAEYKKINNEYQDLKLETELWANKKESFLQRASMVKELCGLYQANYWQLSSVKGNDTTSKTDYAVTRKRLAEHRGQS